ncbi:organic hydroperoxide resistance protein [Paenibacillus sp. PsM32]|uniref:Organic hydroperoxide resistance protein n=2 Tax=Paenibacillus TaxID=44249 RepID=A0ABW4UV61_9BACL|nr:MULTISPECIES: organic hydroperoxide resistance protein [Paenibacillus]MDN4616567.1 organic hydroperoxide resistance protein [Paenibacillus sp. PsM32]MDQ1233643.1 osmotically inducible protein OsmC [Paenibacillus sp. SORGH_AS_0306]MDR6110685.1 osmotically inducible protein OsmC [Paenibacillus sp. SORGH_AS_0338]WCT57567.1 organic hydroperoxide resistance protein [Paenibacillus kyungheensis]WDF49334.1 organic hydroperoxide resistance protein [Paenibacillus sp. KACC 21273]
MLTIQQKMYETTVKAVGGRAGYIESSSPELRLDIATPKEMGGAGGAGTNPEQLFAAGYSACFDSALNMVARMQKIKHEGTEVNATVMFGKAEDGGFALAVKMDVLVKGVDREVATKLVEEAHNVCPYSRATRGNIAVELNVI